MEFRISIEELFFIVVELMILVDVESIQIESSQIVRFFLGYVISIPSFKIENIESFFLYLINRKVIETKAITIKHVMNIQRKIFAGIHL